MLTRLFLKTPLSVTLIRARIESRQTGEENKPFLSPTKHDGGTVRKRQQSWHIITDNLQKKKQNGEHRPSTGNWQLFRNVSTFMRTVVAFVRRLRPLAPRGIVAVPRSHSVRYVVQNLFYFPISSYGFERHNRPTGVRSQSQKFYTNKTSTRRQNKRYTRHNGLRAFHSECEICFCLLAFQYDSVFRFRRTFRNADTHHTIYCRSIVTRIPRNIVRRPPGVFSCLKNFHYPNEFLCTPTSGRLPQDFQGVNIVKAKPYSCCAFTDGVLSFIVWTVNNRKRTFLVVYSKII